MRSATTLLKDSLAHFLSKPVLFTGIYAIGAVFSLFAEYFQPDLNPGATTGFLEWSLFFGIVIVSAIIGVLMGIALILAIANPEMYSVRSAYASAKPFFFRYIGLSIVSSLLILLGFLLFIIPGIIVAVWFTFVYFILVLDGKSIIESLKTSKSLVKGNWWGIFGRLIVVGLVAIIAYTFLGFVTAWLPAIVGLAWTLLISAFIAPFTMIYAFMIYRDLKQANAVTPLP